MEPKRSLRLALMHSSIGQGAVRLMLDALPSSTPPGRWFELDAESTSMWEAFRGGSHPPETGQLQDLVMVAPQDLRAPKEGPDAPPCIRAATGRLPFPSGTCEGLLWCFGF
ncbi:MAG: hypothetical protein ACO3JL_17620, partial [Myxococcota bacterium]